MYLFLIWFHLFLRKEDFFGQCLQIFALCKKKLILGAATAAPAIVTKTNINNNNNHDNHEKLMHSNKGLPHYLPGILKSSIWGSTLYLCIVVVEPLPSLVSQVTHKLLQG